ncbi:MAG: TIGR01212 family radical SAM protein [Lachnospiraceae bacterium]|jgi:radical SAM protein (TIGR01212 family)
MNWNGKPYHSLDSYVREQFGEKLYKLALDGGMTCPNRDGTISYGGCIFCSEGGSGEFAQKQMTSVSEQIEAAKKRLEGKFSGRYIAYFQSYTNTYAPVSYLEPLFMEAILHPDVAALSIATRPDCLPEDVLELLSRLNQIKPVWIELGLQTIHPQTAGLIRRGYPLSCFETAYLNLKKRGLTVIVHVILGLPGETREMMLSTISYLGNLSPRMDGVKLQLLHILKGTSLAAMYQEHPFPVFSMEEYIDFVIDCVELLPPEIVIHRLTGDGPKSLLIAPLWSSNKKLVLNTLTWRFKERASYQGKGLPDR